MDAQEFLTNQLIDVRYQLQMVLEGVDQTTANLKACEVGMTVLEAVSHLAECYVALDKSVDGVEHKWGSYSLNSTGVDDAVKQMFDIRDKAVGRALALNTAEAFANINSYVLLHDAYHVGQLALIRLTADSHWDPYSIYKG